MEAYIGLYFTVGFMFGMWLLMEDGPSRAMVGFLLWPIIPLKHLYRGLIEEFYR